MSLDSGVLARSFRIAADEMTKLAPFIDDLDGVGGGDCDTGTNARVTFEALAHSLSGFPEDDPLSVGLDVALQAGVRASLGHCGILIVSILQSWRVALGEQELTPIRLRRMLVATASASSTINGHTAAFDAMIAEASSELMGLGDTLPEIPEELSAFCAAAQFGLVEATGASTGTIDAGAAVVALMLSALDAACRDDLGMLESLAAMLAELAGQTASRVRPGAPAPDRAFTVDVILQGTQDDCEAHCRHLDALNARYSWIGQSDLFGLGEWRFHIDTAAPLSVRPHRGRTLRFHVADARPDETIGIDTLADGVTHRGIRLLERQPIRRVERAAVVACTRIPGMVEDLALCGAHVFLDPQLEDLEALVQPARCASSGVELIVPSDRDCLALAQRISVSYERLGAEPELSVLIASSHNELEALAVSRACAPLFVPQPGGRQVAPRLCALVEENAQSALLAQHSRPIEADWQVEDISRAVQELISYAPFRWALLAGSEDSGTLIAVLRQLLDGLNLEVSGADLEVIDASPQVHSLVQALS